VSSLSLDRSKHSDSPHGKITPAVLFLLMPNRHFLIKFLKCQNALSILPHEAKALLELFCLQPIIFSWRQNNSSSYFALWEKIKIPHFTLAVQDWIGLMIFKNLADQDWIGFNFIGSGLDSDWKISQSAHLCSTVKFILRTSPVVKFWLEKVQLGRVLLCIIDTFPHVKQACKWSDFLQMVTCVQW